MRKLVFITLCISYCSCFAQKTETLRGKFEYNQLLNEYVTLSDDEKQVYRKMIDSVDTALLNQYFEIIFAADSIPIDDNENIDWDSYLEMSSKKYEKADSLLKTNSFLSGLEGRMIALLYTEHEFVRMGFRDKDYHAIYSDTRTSDETIAVFMTKEQ